MQQMNNCDDDFLLSPFIGLLKQKLPFQRHLKNSYISVWTQNQNMAWYHCGKLEQLEPLRSEDTPRRLMITHTIESYWIPSQKKTKSKLQI